MGFVLYGPTVGSARKGFLSAQGFAGCLLGPLFGQGSRRAPESRGGLAGFDAQRTRDIERLSTSIGLLEATAPVPHRSERSSRAPLKKSRKGTSDPARSDAYQSGRDERECEQAHHFLKRWHELFGLLRPGEGESRKRE